MDDVWVMHGGHSDPVLAVDNEGVVVVVDEVIVGISGHGLLKKYSPEEQKQAK